MTKEEFAAFQNLAAQNKHLAANIMRLEARCDAISMMVEVLGGKAGINSEKIRQAVEKATAVRHQELLEQCEAKHPALAASLDLRSTLPPDLFD